MESQVYQVLLYYKYVAIAEPVVFAQAHLELCRSLNLKGRIIVAAEGINGTVSGTVDDTNEYMEQLRSDERFIDIVFKVDEAKGHAFKKIFVRAKREIVHLGLAEDINPQTLTGNRLKPAAFHQFLQRDDVVIVDGRNDYEYDIGHFEHALRPDVKTFREFPEWIRANQAALMGKKILTYCTGGIRCEKLSGLFLREGFEDVYQLDGGIVSYGKDPEALGQLFAGKCYVFDERIAVPVNQVHATIVGKCLHCGEPAERYLNCGNMDCHMKHLCCEACDNEYHGFCSHGCENAAIANHRVDPLLTVNPR